MCAKPVCKAKTEKLEITQMSTRSKIYKQNMVCSYHRILCSNENKLTEIHASLIFKTIILHRKSQT